MLHFLNIVIINIQAVTAFSCENIYQNFDMKIKQFAHEYGPNNKTKLTL